MDIRREIWKNVEDLINYKEGKNIETELHLLWKLQSLR